MNSIWQTIPVLFLVVCILNGMKGLTTFGTRWTWGRYGMPRSLVTPDATHYLDGTPVDLLQAQLIRAGIEEELLLVIISVLAVFLLLLALEMRRMHFLRRKLATLRHENPRVEPTRSHRHPNR